MSVEIITGNDYAIKFTATVDNSTFNINSGATVTALISSLDGVTIIMASVTCLSSATGADWANSLVVIPITDIQSAAITVYGSAKIQLQVDDGSKSSWEAVIKVVKGNL